MASKNSSPGPNEIKDIVKQHYKNVYKGWTDVEVTEVVVGTFKGNLAVVRSLMKNGQPNEELCFVYNDRTVRHFETTAELARFLEAKAKEPMLERVVSKKVISAVAFFFLLLLLATVAFIDKEYYNQDVVSSLMAAFGLAAGLFFGAGKK